MYPLTEALKGNNKCKLVWSDVCQLSFQTAKSMLTKVVELHHPVPGADVGLTVDASSTHVGAVLHQIVKGNKQPLAFFSVKLSQAEQKYSAFDCELLAIFAAVRHFRFNLEGRPFIVHTDHKPLVLVMGFGY